MPISVVCDSCGATLKISDQFAGRKVKCPKCAGVIIVPAADEVAGETTRPGKKDTTDEVGATRKQRDNNDAATARKRPHTEEDDEDDDRPARNQRRDEDNDRKRAARKRSDDDDRPARKRTRDDDDEPPRRNSKGKGKTKDKGSKKGLIIGLSIGGVLLIAGVIVAIIFLRGDGGGSGGGFGDDPLATEDNFDKIKREMSRDEVEKILGKGQKVSYEEVFIALQKPLPKEGVGSDGTTLKWRNKNEVILIALHTRGAVMAGWFVREQADGTPKYKLLEFGKLK
jgi:predicted Zn finger-like uncharacterized protein